ncbi:MAG: hypothetical protein KF756_09105 [Acidobacteria bacterium]|nr:hypothetical protein [Acidobacteriota bacterium]
MKLNIRIAILGLCVILTSVGFAVAQQPANLNIALQRGYRTGYSDGYMAGYRDTIDNQARDFKRHGEFTKADRAFNKEYGPIEDYRDGYQQGFETGYSTGFEKRSFESTLPAEIHRRGTTAAATTAAPVETPAAPASTTGPTATTAVAQRTETPVTASYSGDPNAIIIIPRDTELLLELQQPLSTETNREGDKFLAKIVSPSEIAGAVVEGRISKIVKPGRIKRRSQMTFSFDRIVISDQRWSNFAATLVEVMPVKGDNIKTVDNEGTAIGKSSLKGDGIKIGASTGAGLVTGAIIGGPVGAGVGAAVGAAFGVGAVVIERGKQIKLNENQQIRIKTSYETQIR